MKNKVSVNSPILRSGSRGPKDDASSWMNWYVYRPDYPIEAIKEEFESYYSHPGGMYAKRPIIRVSSTRILVTQVLGIDC